MGPVTSRSSGESGLETIALRGCRRSRRLLKPLLPATFALRLASASTSPGVRFIPKITDSKSLIPWTTRSRSRQFAGDPAGQQVAAGVAG